VGGAEFRSAEGTGESREGWSAHAPEVMARSASAPNPNAARAIDPSGWGTAATAARPDPAGERCALARGTAVGDEEGRRRRTRGAGHETAEGGR
jgi:hypothetical protein